MGIDIVSVLVGNFASLILQRVCWKAIRRPYERDGGSVFRKRRRVTSGLLDIAICTSSRNGKRLRLPMRRFAAAAEYRLDIPAPGTVDCRYAFPLDIQQTGAAFHRLAVPGRRPVDQLLGSPDVQMIGPARQIMPSLPRPTGETVSTHCLLDQFAGPSACNITIRVQPPLSSDALRSRHTDGESKETMERFVEIPWVEEGEVVAISPMAEPPTTGKYEPWEDMNEYDEEYRAYLLETEVNASGVNPL